MMPETWTEMLKRICREESWIECINQSESDSEGEEENAMVDCVMTLYKSMIFCGSIKTTTLKVGKGLLRSQRHRGKDKVLMKV